MSIITCVLCCDKSVADAKSILLIAYLASSPPLPPLNRAQPGIYSRIHLAPFILCVSGEAEFISKDCVNINSKSHSPSQSPSGKNGQFNQSELLDIKGLKQFIYLLNVLCETQNCWSLLANQLDNEANTEVGRTKRISGKLIQINSGHP